MDFGIVADEEWCLRPTVQASRAQRLLNTSFNDIVEKVVDELSVDSCGVEDITQFPGSRRAWIKLRLLGQTIDLLHSGAGGYRAQFYLGVVQGEAANRYLLDSILSKLQALYHPAKPTRKIPWEVVAASLGDADAKVWINQGAWLRTKTHADRNMQVERWLQLPKIQSARTAKLRLWAQLMPDAETRIDIKGGCLDKELHSLCQKLKPNRSYELNRFGYT